jgi:hypothetical protein
MTNALLLYREGKADDSKTLSLAATELTETPNYWVEPVYRALADPGMRDAALAAVNQAWDEQLIIPDIVLIVRTLLGDLDGGDLDGAMEIAELLEDEGEAFSTEMIFVPEIAPLRRHPDFMPLLDRLGIVAYWNELGCTWDGDRVHCPMD